MGKRVKATIKADHTKLQGSMCDLLFINGTKCNEFSYEVKCLCNGKIINLFILYFIDVVHLQSYDLG